MESWLAPAGFAAGQAQAFPSTRLHPKGLLPEQVVTERQQVTLLLQELLQQGPYLHSSRSPLVLFAPAEPFYRMIKGGQHLGLFMKQTVTRTHTRLCVFVHTQSHVLRHTLAHSHAPELSLTEWWLAVFSVVGDFWWFVCVCVFAYTQEVVWGSVFHLCKNGCCAFLPASFNTQINYA